MFDWRDAVGGLGFGSLLAGVGFVYWPASLILAGVVLLVVYFFLERRRVP